MAITDSMAAQKEAQQAGVSRILKKNDPAYNGNVSSYHSFHSCFLSLQEVSTLEGSNHLPLFLHVCAGSSSEV